MNLPVQIPPAIRAAFALAGAVTISCTFAPRGGMVTELAETPTDLAVYKLIDLPYSKADLIIAGEAMPVEMVRVVESPGTITFLLRSEHEVVLEHETYKFDPNSFALSRAGGELYEPPIPLLINPITAGTQRNWKGRLHAAVDGKVTGKPGDAKAATAKVELQPDKLNLLGGAKETLRADVTLHIESGGPTPAERRLTFWFLEGGGIVKRDFAFASTRAPRSITSR